MERAHQHKLYLMRTRNQKESINRNIVKNIKESTGNQMICNYHQQMMYYEVVYKRIKMVKQILNFSDNNMVFHWNFMVCIEIQFIYAH